MTNASPTPMRNLDRSEFPSKISTISPVGTSIARTRTRTRTRTRAVDLCDKAALYLTLAQVTPIDAVVHFAGLKAVGESTREPLLYYDNNITGTLNLLAFLQVPLYKCCTCTAVIVGIRRRGSDPCV